MELPKEVRPSVARMARHMEMRLRENENRGGWHNMTRADFVARLQMNLDDIKVEHASAVIQSSIIQQATADLANYAMMLSETDYLDASCGAA